MSLRLRREAFSSATAGSSTTWQPKRCSGGAGRPRRGSLVFLTTRGGTRRGAAAADGPGFSFSTKRWRSPPGDRPCFFCRAAAEAFRTAWGKAKGGKVPLAPEMDAVLHKERLGRSRKRVHAIPGPVAELPEGTVIAAGGEAYTIVQGRSFRWSERGYQVGRLKSASEASGCL